MLPDTAVGELERRLDPEGEHPVGVQRDRPEELVVDHGATVKEPVPVQDVQVVEQIAYVHVDPGPDVAGGDDLLEPDVGPGDVVALIQRARLDERDADESVAAGVVQRSTDVGGADRLLAQDLVPGEHLEES